MMNHLGLKVRRRNTKPSSFHTLRDRSKVEKLPGYTVTDLLVRYAPPGKRNFEAFVAVDNLLDEEYASQGYLGWEQTAYYPSPGRTLRAGATCRF